MKLSRCLVFLTPCMLLTSCLQRSGVKRDPRWDTAKVTFVEDNGKYDLEDLKKQKVHIDSLAADTAKLIVMAKAPGKNEPVKVVNGKYPEEVETTFNFLMTNDGKIIYTVEIPYSESGDWFISYHSYFDKYGRLFAFERKANFFNSECASEDGGVAYEDLTRFYNATRLVDSTYKLTEKGGKPLIKSKCNFEYEYPYKVITDIDSFLSDNYIHSISN